MIEDIGRFFFLALAGVCIIASGCTGTPGTGPPFPVSPGVTAGIVLTSTKSGPDPAAPTGEIRKQSSGMKRRL